MTTKLYRLRGMLLLIIVAVLWLLTPFVKSALEIDNSLSIWFLQNDPAVQDYNNFNHQFGNDEVLIAVVEKKTGLLDAESLGKFRSATSAIEAIPEVRSAITPGNATIITKDYFGVHIKQLISPTTTRQQVINDLETAPTLRQQIFDSAYTSARFLVSFHSSPDFEKNRGRMLDTVKSIIEQSFGPEQSYFGGVGILYDGLNKLSRADFGFFLSVGYLMMFVLLVVIYRRFYILLYAILTVTVATYATLGVYGYFGFHLNLMTVLIPCILIVLGIMDIMHILNEYYHQSRTGISNKSASIAALKKMFLPCLFTTLTTMAGFLSLLSSPMAILKEFGVFTALGILFCLLFTYLFGIILLPLSSPAKVSLVPVQKIVNRFFEHLLLRKKLYSRISAVLVLLCLAGLFFLKSDTYTLGYFPKTDQAVTDNSKMEASWGPYMPVEFVLTPKAPFKLRDPEILKAAIAFADAAKKMEGAGQPFGYQSLYQGGLRSLYGDQAEKRLNSKGSINMVNENLQTFYPDLYASFVNEKTNTGRITIVGGMMGSRQLTKKIDTLLSLSQKTFAGKATLKPAGYQPLYAKIVSYVVTSQVKSLLISALLIFVLLYLLVKDLRIALLSTVANLIPVAFMMGIMGWFNIDLDTASASIAAIVLSVCIDDTIHFIFKYKKLKSNGAGSRQATQDTMHHLGASIFLSSFVLIAGYSLMIFASLQTVVLFGLLTVIALAAASYVSFVIFPLLLLRFDGPSQTNLPTE